MKRQSKPISLILSILVDIELSEWFLVSEEKVKIK